MTDPLRLCILCSDKKWKEFFRGFVEWIQLTNKLIVWCRAVLNLESDEVVSLHQCAEGTSSALPFVPHVLIHKLSEDLLTKDVALVEAAVTRWTASRGVVLLDGLPGVLITTDRCRFAATVHCLLANRHNSSPSIFFACPRWYRTQDLLGLSQVEVFSVKHWIIKSVVACSRPGSHKMWLSTTPCSCESALNFAGTLETCEGVPLLVQEFLSDALPVVFKVYAMAGSVLHVAAISSEPLYQIQSEPSPSMFVCFESSNKSLFRGSISPLLEGIFEEGSSYRTLLKEFTSELSKLLNLHLLGFDVLVEPNLGRCTVVDINYFPSYKGVPSCYDSLTNLLFSLKQ